MLETERKKSDAVLCVALSIKSCDRRKICKLYSSGNLVKGAWARDNFPTFLLIPGKSEQVAHSGHSESPKIARRGPVYRRSTFVDGGLRRTASDVQKGHYHREDFIFYVYIGTILWHESIYWQEIYL